MAKIKLSMSGDPGVILEWIGNLKKAATILDQDAQVIYDSCTHRGKFTHAEDEESYREAKRLSKWLRMLGRGLGKPTKRPTVKSRRAAA